MGINQKNANQRIPHTGKLLENSAEVLNTSVVEKNHVLFGDQDYIDDVKNEIQNWAKTTTFGPRIHNIIGSFDSWVNAQVKWVDNPVEWDNLNLEENKRCYDNTLRYLNEEFKKLVETGEAKPEHIGGAIESDEFEEVPAIFNNDTGIVYLNKSYHTKLRPTIMEIKKNILHELGHYISNSENRNKLDYDFTEWEELYTELRDRDMLPSTYASLNPCEGYAELFRKYWGSNSGLRRFQLSDYPPEVLKAIGVY